MVIGIDVLFLKIKIEHLSEVIQLSTDHNILALASVCKNVLTICDIISCLRKFNVLLQNERSSELKALLFSIHTKNMPIIMTEFMYSMQSYTRPRSSHSSMHHLNIELRPSMIGMGLRFEEVHTSQSHEESPAYTIQVIYIVFCGRSLSEGSPTWRR